ncbi:uncharacterized protein JN550_001321 [Neoarthrinium moseri]|uniref:uncharacterized protein n=1 Tax=Neoarthrinium moseri TaxID=1658444 RepID=UPI001FDE1BE2|nr:uncharacterized protein JN550_001321 [Neoarthrinium moseri]KAI1877249.1 hypothetical protein JN550_001321 [Neoarthrinium moseri]
MTRDSTKPAGSAQASVEKPEVQHRVLSQAEWIQFCRGVGVFKDLESTNVIRPACWYWPAKGFPDGLYQDVLWEKSKFTWFFHLLSAVRWTLMILQLSLNAVLTALGSLSLKNGTVITVIAGINTLFAGLLALIHNSGLPDRYRSDRNEFSKVEQYLKEIIDTRLVPADDTIVEVLASCFDKFSDARQTVQNNIPASYAPSAITPATLKAMQKGVTEKK